MFCDSCLKKKKKKRSSEQLLKNNKWRATTWHRHIFFFNIEPVPSFSKDKKKKGNSEISTLYSLVLRRGSGPCHVIEILYLEELDHSVPIIFSLKEQAFPQLLIDNRS